MPPTMVTHWLLKWIVVDEVTHEDARKCLYVYASTNDDKLHMVVLEVGDFGKYWQGNTRRKETPKPITMVKYSAGVSRKQTSTVTV